MHPARKATRRARRRWHRGLPRRRSPPPRQPRSSPPGLQRRAFRILQAWLDRAGWGFKGGRERRARTPSRDGGRAIDGRTTSPGADGDPGSGRGDPRGSRIERHVTSPGARKRARRCCSCIIPRGSTTTVVSGKSDVARDAGRPGSPRAGRADTLCFARDLPRLFPLDLPDDDNAHLVGPPVLEPAANE